MKKSVLALAVLGAFSSVAMAQSSVTLYGRLDTSISYAEPGKNAANDDGVWRVNGNAPIGGSRWGIKGTEDLGGGLKANFVLESGFNSDTGAPGNSAKLFDRQAWVGLSSASLGDIRLGRQDTLTRQTNLFASDITSEGELNVVETVATGRALFQNFGSRVDNSVGYYSPSFGGFKVAALVGLGEKTTARQQGVMLSYAAGPLKLAATYEGYAHKPLLSGNPAQKSAYNEVVTLGAKYDFGVATVALGYQNTSDVGSATSYTAGTDHDAYNVGVLVPFGSAFEFRAQFTTSTMDTPTGNVDTDKYGMSLRYNLSKRTTVYAVATTRAGDGKNSYDKKDEIAFGIGHNF